MSANSFDQTILRDGVTNKLTESVNMFNSIVNKRSVPVILIFNKTDLLIEKIKVQNIKDYFTDFQVRGITPFIYFVLACSS